MVTIIELTLGFALVLLGCALWATKKRVIFILIASVGVSLLLFMPASRIYVFVESFRPVTKTGKTDSEYSRERLASWWALDGEKGRSLRSPRQGLPKEIEDVNCTVKTTMDGEYVYMSFRFTSYDRISKRFESMDTSSIWKDVYPESLAPKRSSGTLPKSYKSFYSGRSERHWVTWVAIDLDGRIAYITIKDINL